MRTHAVVVLVLGVVTSAGAATRVQYLANRDPTGVSSKSDGHNRNVVEQRHDNTIYNSGAKPRKMMDNTIRNMMVIVNAAW